MQSGVPVGCVTFDAGEGARKSAYAAVPQAVALNQGAAVFHQGQQGTGGDEIAGRGGCFGSGQGAEYGEIGDDALRGEGAESARGCLREKIATLGRAAQVTA